MSTAMLKLAMTCELCLCGTWVQLEESFEGVGKPATLSVSGT